MALKLDMTKAFDGVEWQFLENIMLKLGFSPGWVSLVMKCVQSPSLSFLLNSSPVGYFPLVVAFVRATQYHPSYSYYVQKVFHPHLPMLLKLMLFMD